MRIRKQILTVAICLAVAAVLFAVGLVLYSVQQNKTIIVSEYTIAHKQIPASFNGKRIVQLTDLHNHDFGDDLTQRVQSLSPDVLVITGDWIGMNDTDITVAKAQATALVEIAPTYYVPGNHEAVSPVFGELRTHLEAVGVTVLGNTTVHLEQDGEAIQLAGMFDQEFSTHLWRDFAPLVEHELYTVLLLHRPEYFEEATGFGADLILSGHTHGGQIRLPLIGAVFAPNQGWFPRYDVGRFDSGESTLIVGQGLGESVYMRILTPPEIVVVNLKSE